MGPLLTLLGLLASVLAGCDAVTVETVALTDNLTHTSVQYDQPTVMGCWFTLAEEEVLDEVVWEKDGVRVLPSTEIAPTPPSALWVSEYQLPNVTRSSAGVFVCTVVTKGGGEDTRDYDLLVIDVPERSYSHVGTSENCAYYISTATPPAYPEATAFIGIWVNATSGGHWLEPPPPRAQDGDRVAEADDHKVAYSTEREEDGWVETITDGDFISYSINNASINVADTPDNSHVRSFFGFYKTDGSYVTLNSFDYASQYSVPPELQCPKDSLEKYTSKAVLLLYTPHIDTCRGYFAPRPPLHRLGATLRCGLPTEFHLRVMDCDDNVWKMWIDGHLVEDYEEGMEQFVSMCEDLE